MKPTNFPPNIKPLINLETHHTVCVHVGLACVGTVCSFHTNPHSFEIVKSSNKGYFCLGIIYYLKDLCSIWPHQKILVFLPIHRLVFMTLRASMILHKVYLQAGSCTTRFRKNKTKQNNKMKQLKFESEKRTYNFVNWGILTCNVFTLKVIHENITSADCPSFLNCGKAFLSTAMYSG